MDGEHADGPAKKEEPDSTGEGGHNPLPPQPLTVDNFRDQALKALASILTEHLGPRQYLTHHLGDVGSEACCEFAAELAAQYPTQPGVQYGSLAEFKQWPRDATLVVRIKDLGFHEACSTKPPPLKVTCLQLLDEYILNGFDTGGQGLSASGNAPAGIES